MTGGEKNENDKQLVVENLQNSKISAIRHGFTRILKWGREREKEMKTSISKRIFEVENENKRKKKNIEINKINKKEVTKVVFYPRGREEEIEK